MKRLLPYVGPIIGLTGVSLALYFHAQSVQERVPTFYVSPQRAVIVDARGPTSSDLQVLYRGKSVSASVTAVTVYLWNEGRLPIRSSDVLGDPVSIELSPGADILEARLLKTSRPVIRFSKGDVTEKAKNSLPLSFDILEKDDGAAVQLVYAGDPSAAVAVRGTIVGARAPRLLRPEDSGFTALPNPRRRRQVDRFLGYVNIVLGLGAVIAGLVHQARHIPQNSYTRRYPLLWAYVAFGVFWVLFGAYILYEAHRAEFPGVPATIWADS